MVESIETESSSAEMSTWPAVMETANTMTVATMATPTTAAIILLWERWDLSAASLRDGSTSRDPASEATLMLWYADSVVASSTRLNAA